MLQIVSLLNFFPFQQGEPNYFNRFADGAMPAVRFSDFERLRERTLMAEDTAAIIWETLQRFNLAIVASIQGNNESLLEMGFTRELGHQYPGIRLVIESFWLEIVKNREK